jgi:hypothetical protein
VSVVSSLDEACTILCQGGTPAEIAARWGVVDDPTSRLMLVTPTDGRWKRVRVLVDPSGEVDEVVFEVADGEEVAVADLTAAYGEAEEERAMDGPLVLWFDQKRSGGCRIAAFVQRASGDAPTTRQLAVIRPTLA